MDRSGVWRPPTDPFGSVFVNGMEYDADKEGLASLHFDSPGHCYISHANSQIWRLDDGSRLRDATPFTDFFMRPGFKNL